MHPGGELLLVNAGGKDVSKEFWGLHKNDVLEKYKRKLQIGVVAGKPKIVEQSRADISTLPYSEFNMGEDSPYYNDSHRALRKWLRAFLAEHVMEEAEEYERTEGVINKDMYLKLGAEGIFAAWLGPKPGHHLSMVDKLPPGIVPGKMDYFHEAIIHSEFSRMMTPGFEDGLVGGRNISVPVMLWFASKELQERVVPPILRGEQHSALAITEAFAGTDVSNILTTATKTPCGRFFIVNGTKKWITEGHKADYFMTLTKGPDGKQTMLLIDGKAEGWVVGCTEG